MQVRGLSARNGSPSCPAVGREDEGRLEALGSVVSASEPSPLETFTMTGASDLSSRAAWRG
jgi:hypothetical protein